MSDTERVILNLSAKDAKAVYDEIERQVDKAGWDNCEDLRPAYEQLSEQLEKMVRAVDSETSLDGDSR